jgi:hypothetical protein
LERAREPLGEGGRVLDERLHLGLAEVAAAGVREAAAEALRARDADPRVTHLHAEGRSFEHPDAAGGASGGPGGQVAISFTTV